MEYYFTQQKQRNYSFYAMLAKFVLNLRLIICSILLFITAGGYAQQPAISYASPQVYFTDKGFAPLTPTSSGVASFGFGNSPVTLGTGLAFPTGVAIDAAGNLYFTHHDSNQIQEIPANGGPRISLGTGLIQPTQIAVDAAANIFVVDDGGVVKKIPAGGGAATTLSIRFQSVSGIAVDGSENVYVTSGSTIYEIPAGSNSFVNLGAQNYGFQTLSAIAVDSSGNIYVCDKGSSSVKELPAGGSSIITIGSGFKSPSAIALDGVGNVYIGDVGNDALYKVPVGGGPKTTLWSSDSFVPSYVAADATGNIYVGDAFNVISKFPAAGGPPVTVIAGVFNPHAIATDAAGNIFFTEQGTGKVKKIPAGDVNPVTVITGLNYPSGVAVDKAGNLYVSDSGNGLVKKFPAGGGAAVTLASGLNFPGNMVLDAFGNLYVLTSDLILIMLPAQGGAPVTLASGFSSATGLAIDGGGNLFVADTYTVKEVPAGITGNRGSSAILSGFNNATAVALDAAGNLYVDDVVKGLQVFLKGSGSGIPLNMGVAYFGGLAMDGAGNLVTAISARSVIQKLSPIGGYFMNPQLPAGFKFDSNTGVIKGIPIAVSPATNYTVTAYNGLRSASTTLNITVKSPLPTVSYGGPETYKQGTAITPLVPASSAVSAPAYSNAPIAGNAASTTPLGLAIDASGNFYVSSNQTSEVKKITPAGSITDVGSGFHLPLGLAEDRANNLYIVDAGNHALKELAPGGGAPVTLATGLTLPQGDAVDFAGNVYIADGQNNTVTKYPLGGGTPVIIGSGFNEPIGVAVDGDGNVYVGGNVDNKVWKIPFGGGAPVVLASGFNGPGFIAVDASGNVFVSDNLHQQVKEIPAGSTTPIIIGSVAYPQAIALDAGGNLYVTINPGTLFEFKATGGFHISPFLPPGMHFDNATGIISGTPRVSSPATNYTITAYNSFGSASATVNIGVTGGSPNATLTSLHLSAGTLSPSFSTGTLNYNAIESIGLNTLYVTPTAQDTTSSIKVNGAAVKSGKAAAVTLVAGINTVSIVVTSKDKSDSRTYTLTIGKGSQIDKLSGLQVSGGLLSPAFSADSLNYTASVSKTTGSVTVTPRTAVSTANITVNGTAVTSGTASAPITLNVGANTIKVVVTAQDGLNNQTYTITVTRPAPPTITPGAVSGSITTCVGDASASPNIQQFTISGSSLNANILATAPANFQVSLAPGSGYGHAVALTQTAGAVNNQLVYVRVTGAAPVGTEAGNVVLTSTGATTQNVAVAGTVEALATVNRPSDQTLYSGQKTKAINFTGTAGKFSWVNNTVGIGLASSGVGNIAPLTAVNLGTGPVAAVITVTPEPSAGQAICPGPPVNFYITVYPVITTLASLGLSTGMLSPTFSPSTTDYDVTVNSDVSTFTVTPTVTDAKASIKVNGVGVLSGAASTAIPLSPGNNTITLVVTAGDGFTTKTYTVTVHRKSPNNANLAQLHGNEGFINQVFSPTVTNYTLNVSYNNTSISFTPVAQDTLATIRINGIAVASGMLSQVIPLNEGSNIVTTVVTAADGVTTKTYSINVVRAGSSFANLVVMHPDMGSITPTFLPTITSYTGSVFSTTSSFTIAVATYDPLATIKVNGEAVASGSSSQSISLAYGDNTINIIVTAPDGVTTQTYTLVVNRPGHVVPSADAAYQPIGVEPTNNKALLADDGISVHQGVSPNGDGINDFLTIENISNYPDNKLSIINRNGQLVFEAKGYDNASKVFDGRSNKNGKMQLPGTYFYQLDYTANGVTKHKTGYLVLKY